MRVRPPPPKPAVRRPRAAARAAEPVLRLALRPPRPFDFPLTALVLRRTDRNAIDRMGDDGVWSRVVDLPSGPALLRGRQVGAQVVFEAAPAREPAGHSDLAALRAFVTRLFSLDVDLSPFWQRARREPGFGDLARLCAGLRPQRFPTLFESLANGICCQQLSLEAGLTMLGRLAERCGKRPRGDARFGPPDPTRVAAAPPSLFREVGLSARRGQFLQALARMDLRALGRELDALPDAAVRRRLLDLPGVGPWTADYVMVRGLGRLGVFPRGDVGASRGLSRVLGRAIAPNDAPAVAERFAPLQGMLYFCMIGYAIASAREASEART